MDTRLGGNEVSGGRAPHGRWSSPRPTRGESAYLLVVAAIATWGFVAGSTTLIVLAALVALPTSVPAVIGFYVAYGLLAQLPGANPSSSSGGSACSSSGVCRGSVTGDAATWFLLTTDVIGILALTVAALVNVAILRGLRARHRDRALSEEPRGS
jgi:hypothetical protein